MKSKIFLLGLLLGVPNFAFPAETGQGGTGSGTGSGSGEAQHMTTAQALPGNEKIVEPFKKQFESCTQKVLNATNCKFDNMGIMGDEAHQQRVSCHNIGEAIDVGIIDCNHLGSADKEKVDPKPGNPTEEKYFQMVQCMVGEGAQSDSSTSSAIPDTSGAEEQLQAIYHKNQAGQGAIGRTWANLKSFAKDKWESWGGRANTEKIMVHGNHENHMHIQLAGCMARARAAGGGKGSGTKTGSATGGGDGTADAPKAKGDE
jgi:hypothetical protein